MTEAHARNCNSQGRLTKKEWPLVEAVTSELQVQYRVIHVIMVHQSNVSIHRHYSQVSSLTMVKNLSTSAAAWWQLRIYRKLYTLQLAWKYDKLNLRETDQKEVWERTRCLVKPSRPTAVDSWWLGMMCCLTQRDRDHYCDQRQQRISSDDHPLHTGTHTTQINDVITTDRQNVIYDTVYITVYNSYCATSLFSLK